MLINFKPNMPTIRDDHRPFHQAAIFVSSAHPLSAAHVSGLRPLDRLPLPAWSFRVPERLWASKGEAGLRRCRLQVFWAVFDQVSGRN